MVTANPKNPETVRFTIDLDESLHRQFKSWCAGNGLKIADVLREMIGSRVNSKE